MKKINETKALEKLITGFVDIFGNEAFIREQGTEIFNKTIEVNIKPLRLMALDFQRMLYEIEPDNKMLSHYDDELMDHIKHGDEVDDNTLFKLNQELTRPYMKLFLSQIGVNEFNYPTSKTFKYFKGVKLSDEPEFKSVTLYSSGLELEKYSTKYLKYRIEDDGNLRYEVSTIPFAFNKLGQIVANQRLVYQLKSEIREDMSKATKHSYMSEFLKLNKWIDTDMVISELQTEGITDIYTTTQTHEKLSKMEPRDFPDKLF